MPALVVATTGNPAATTALAVATSQAFGSRRGAPGRCSDRSRSHRLWSSLACEVVMSGSLLWMPSGRAAEALARDALAVAADVVDAARERQPRDRRGRAPRVREPHTDGRRPPRAGVARGRARRF